MDLLETVGQCDNGYACVYRRLQLRMRAGQRAQHLAGVGGLDLDHLQPTGQCPQAGPEMNLNHPP